MPQALTAGGGSSAASHVELKLVRACEPSQNGFLADCPQRQSETTVRPARPHAFPPSSWIVMAPSRRRGPLFLTVILKSDMNPHSMRGCGAR